MRLKNLTLNNFGVYRGKVTFDFELKDKPIILFGGKNGSGKTTLLEAIKLCLYGHRAMGRKFTRNEYDRHIRNRVHRQRGTIVPPNHIEIALRFYYSQLGLDHEYEIFRSWIVRPDSIQEQLNILVDNKPLAGIPEENWQEFVDDLIPPNVIDLFFFDGEKIQDLVIDNLNQQTLAVEVKRLLGLNIIERLQADLDTYQNRQRKENSIPEIKAKLHELEDICTIADQKYQEKNRELSQAENSIANISGHVEKLERQISQESSGYAFQRENLKTQLTQVDFEREVVEKQLQELSSGLLPFSLIPELCQQLKNQIIEETATQRWSSSVKALSPKIIHAQDKIKSAEFWGGLNGSISIDVRSTIEEQFLNVLKGILDVEEDYRDIQILHQISDQDRMRIITWVDEAINETPLKVRKLGERLAFLEHQRQEMLVKLRNVPDDSVLRPLIEELNTLNQQLAECKIAIARLEQEKRVLDNSREEAQRQLKKAFENYRLGQRVEERLALVKKAQLVLQELLLEMTKKKIAELGGLVMTHFNSLIRKPDLVNRVEINPNNFEIQLFDTEEKLIPKEFLSAGEKQMFAIALLWALRDLSGKPFPVIIDTPLGRLDSDHRDHLVNTYFPQVSHQVILFSTDTEIDEAYFTALEPHISHSFSLNYDPASGSTSVSNGYFWEGGKR